jgi:prepilin-type N-terminal cleavage/methylation domain-containing protein
MVLSNNKKGGFTIVEMMTVIFIMSILSTIVVASYRNNEEARNLKLQAQLAVDGLERAQNYALTGSTVNGNQIPVAYQFIVKQCFEEIDNCQYEIWAKINNGETDIFIESRSFNKVNIGNNFSVDFFLPRGKIEITEEAKENFTITNDVGSYLIEVNAVSGRINMTKDEN